MDIVVEQVAVEGIATEDITTKDITTEDRSMNYCFVRLAAHTMEYSRDSRVVAIVSSMSIRGIIKFELL